MPAAAPSEASTYNRATRRAWTAKKKAIAQSDNPEQLKEAADNTLFGKKRKSEDGTDMVPKVQKQKRARADVLKTDPAAAKATAARKADTHSYSAAKGAGSKRSAFKPASKASGSASSTPYNNIKPHGEAVKVSLHAWERLRQDKTPAAERAQLIDTVLASFQGTMVQVLQKHDAARVLQSCYRLGNPEQRKELMTRIKGQVVQLSLSHYGHFFVMCIVRHGTTEHKKMLEAELRGHVCELVTHAEGSAVLQLVYNSVATPAQRNAMYRETWGKDFALLGQSKQTSLAQLFEEDPAAKPRVLRRMEALLSKAARKGLAMTTLVQRGLADLLQHADAGQQAVLASVLKEAVPHIMHTRDGARIACSCLRYTDPKDRKTILKALKGYVARAACDANAALVLCVALEVVDDTVLLRKAIVSELLAELPSLAVHAHGSLPVLALLAPRDKRYFEPAQLSIMGEAGSGLSKKDSTQRRDELLQVLLPPLCRLCASQVGSLARSPHGCSVLFEAVQAASVAESVESSPVLRALAEASIQQGEAAVGGGPGPATVGQGEEGEEGEVVAKAKLTKRDVTAEFAHLPLVSHPYGARLLKRLVQAQSPFAGELCSELSGSLKQWAFQGGGWLVLALLECESTSATVVSELSADVAAISSSDALGCRSLADALAKVQASVSVTGKEEQKSTKVAKKRKAPK